MSLREEALETARKAWADYIWVMKYLIHNRLHKMLGPWGKYTVFDFATFSAQTLVTFLVILIFKMYFLKFF